MKVLQEKINDMQETMNQMTKLKNSYREKEFELWKSQTRDLFPDMHPNEANYLTDISFFLNGEKVLLYIAENNQLYCQINFEPQKNINGTKINELKNLLPKEHAKARWKYFSSTDFDGVYDLFIEVVNRCRDIMDK
jgi:hypothetical protein